MRHIAFVAAVAVCLLSIPRSAPAAEGNLVGHGTLNDLRDIRRGLPIPDENYCDQPYVVITKDGNWLCTMTTGPGKESDKGQHVVATISSDRGQTWSKLIDIEPSAGPEASWVVPLVVPSGRVYGFYNYNGDRIRTLDGKEIKGDELGWYVYKYSDDNGRSWSRERYRLPVRVTACDRSNAWHGKVQMFWGIDKPQVAGSAALFAFSKLGRYQEQLGEGWYFRSDNILAEQDVARLHWELLPDGDRGVRAEEFGSVQEEHNLVPLSDGTLYCVYRTTLGHPCHAYSTDGGHTWTRPEPMTYAPGGRTMKTPRACPMVWRAQNGKYLFWFHNHGVHKNPYLGRNPVWLSGGVERNGSLHWSQPEILLYDTDPKNAGFDPKTGIPEPHLGMSYPDLIEQDDCYWVTATQKSVARVHAIDKNLLEGLWSQGQVKTVAQAGLMLELGPKPAPAGCVRLPKALNLAEGSGLSVELWIRFHSLGAGQVILDSRSADGRGLLLTTTQQGTVRIELADGHTKAAWDTDPGVLQTDKLHHLTVIVDSGARIISFLVDGVLCDGGKARRYGWARFSPALADVTGSGELRVAPSLRGRLELLRVYDRCLRTSEAVGNYHHERSAREVSQ